MTETMTLPAELVPRMAWFLPTRDVSALPQVCREWNNVLSNHGSWQQEFFQARLAADFGEGELLMELFPEDDATGRRPFSFQQMYFAFLHRFRIVKNEDRAIHWDNPYRSIRDNNVDAPPLSEEARNLAFLVRVGNDAKKRDACGVLKWVQTYYGRRREDSLMLDTCFRAQAQMTVMALELIRLLCISPLNSPGLDELFLLARSAARKSSMMVTINVVDQQRCKVLTMIEIDPFVALYKTGDLDDPRALEPGPNPFTAMKLFGVPQRRSLPTVLQIENWADRSSSLTEDIEILNLKLCHVDIFVNASRAPGNDPKGHLGVRLNFMDPGQTRRDEICSFLRTMITQKCRPVLRANV